MHVFVDVYVGFKIKRYRNRNFRLPIFDTRPVTSNWLKFEPLVPLFAFVTCENGDSNLEIQFFYDSCIFS